MTTAVRSILPWEDWRPGDDDHTSGWMRATAPGGDAEFVGEVGWSGELGYGVVSPRGAEMVEVIACQKGPS